MISAVSFLLAQGGLVMGMILLLSVYMTTIIVYKIYQFLRLKTVNPMFLELLAEEQGYDRMQQGLQEANIVQNPVARVMLSAVKVLEDSHTDVDVAKDEIKRVGMVELRYLEGYMRGLEMVANIAPLLGLLGTVLGMVEVFSALESAGNQVDPSLLAGGIWTALLTTVAGLGVAIIAMAAHYLFDAHIEGMRAQMNDAATRILTTRFGRKHLRRVIR